MADGGRFYNRGFVIDPSGHTDYYDKRHLFVLGREPMLYTPGEAQAPIVTFRGWKIKMSICYDLRFPVWNRWTDEAPYDLLVIPANWPTHVNLHGETSSWPGLSKTRPMWRGATVWALTYMDPTAMIYPISSNHWGDEMGAPRQRHRHHPATLDGKSLDHDRARFPNLAAADDFVISMQ